MIDQQLSGVAIVICIAIGFTTFVLLFIFGKRQIMRFALKSRRGPHVPIASDAPKGLRKEIERRLDVVKDIKLDPQLLLTENSSPISTNPHIYRMKAVDALKVLESDISSSISSNDNQQRRPPGQDLKFYLMRMARDGGPLESCEKKLLEDFAERYNHARHEALPDFGVDSYKEYMKILHEIRSKIKPVQGNGGSHDGLKNRIVNSSSVVVNGQNVVRTGGVNVETSV